MCAPTPTALELNSLRLSRWAELHSFRLVRLAVTLFGDTLGQQPIDTIRHSKIDSTPGWAAVIERKQTLVADGSVVSKQQLGLA